MITWEKVLEIHDLILEDEPGLSGHHGSDAIQGALSRIESRILYENLDDVFEIAAMYAIAISRGHIFNDANKRTALLTCLTYLSIQGIDIPRDDYLEEIMVEVAQGKIELKELSDILYSIKINSCM
jgi:death-on-curing protein